MSQSKPSGLSAALGHEQIGLEPFGLELMAERLTAERLGPNGVSNISETIRQNTSPYLRIEALRIIKNTETSAGGFDGPKSTSSRIESRH